MRKSGAKTGQGKTFSISALLFSAFKSRGSLLQAQLPSQHFDHTRKLWISKDKGSKKSIFFYLLFYLWCSSSCRIESFLCWEYTTEHVEGCNISRSWMVWEYLQHASSFRRSYDPEMCHSAKSQKAINLILLFFSSWTRPYLYHLVKLAHPVTKKSLSVL